MPKNIEISKFRDVAARYRVLLFDASGVLKVTDRLIDGVPAVLKALTDAGRPPFLLTNDASRSPAGTAERYHVPDFGQLIPEARIVTSGMQASAWLAANCAGRKVGYLGPVASEYYFQSAGVAFARIENVRSPDEIDVFVITDNGGFEWREGLNQAVNLIRARPQIPLVAPNPDLVYPVRGGGVAIASGAMARMLGEITGRKFLHFGKPDPGIFRFALGIASRQLRDVKPSEVLMVGDTLETDIVGANAAGIDTLLVLSGNCTPEGWRADVERTGIRPKWVAESVLT